MKQNKDVTICFRTSAKVQASLKAAAEREQMNVSALINSVLNDFLKTKSGSDKRRHTRKDASIPVIINGETASGTVLLTGTIQDLSLGGVRIAIPDHEQTTLVINAGVKHFEIVFRLPDGSTRPVSMTCKPSRVSKVGEDLHIGASFQDGDLQSYFEIQSYVM
ncbi:MAG: PilZ domain-containing protein [Humidesulfovibrio sp.]|nr:PilZ domain-containing protein [Humidesulfovibrio sp.]